MELVTFLILTYNSERWIEECLDSVINQTYKNLQILIIDDGSTDSTVSLINKFSDSRIELFIKEHSGISKSLNFSLNKIKGKFIAKIGSDDLCESNRVSKQLEFLYKNPSFGIIGTNFILIDSLGNEIMKVLNPRDNLAIKDQLLRRCCIWDGSILMKKKILLSVNGYDERRTFAEDWDLFIRLINKTNFYNIQEFLSTKRVHALSISETREAKEESKKILYSYNNYIIKNSKLNSEVAKSYFNIGYYNHYKSDFLTASDYFHKAIERGGLNLQFLRYYFSSKYLSFIIRYYRKYKIYKLFNWINFFDRNNVLMRNKF